MAVCSGQIVRYSICLWQCNAFLKAWMFVMEICDDDSHTSDRCTHDITMPWCMNFWMYILTSVFTLRLCTLSTDFAHECILYISPACRHVDPHYIWTSSLFNSSLCACICAYLCVCVCGEQLRYRACRGRELISAEDDCVIWTADQHWGSKWREAGELVRPAAAC